MVIDLTAVPEFPPPTIMSAERTAADEAVVMFEIFSLGVFNIRYYFANDTSTPDLVCVHFCVVIMLGYLSPCTPFVDITADSICWQC